jgi:GNAT superfamily N-acetyltransferase
VSDAGRVEPLDRARHDVDDFACGQPTLDGWLRNFAGQAQRRDAARTFVSAGPGGKVIGYYTLVVAEVAYERATGATRRGLSRHFPIPVCLIARLAVRLQDQGRGIGSDLLRDALGRIATASSDVGIRAVVVDAIDQVAARFYRQYGFESLAEDELTLMVPMAAVRRTVAQGP